MNRRDLTLWLILATLWGSSFLAIGVAVETVEPAIMVAGRMGLGAVLLLGVTAITGHGLPASVGGWGVAALVGLTGNVLPFWLIGWAEQSVASGRAALIMGAAPIITLVLAPLIHAEESLTPRKLAGACVGFSGVALLVGPAAMAGAGGALLPQTALLAAALCYAATALISRRFAQGPPLAMAAGSVLCGAVAILVLTALNPAELTITTSAGLAILWLGAGPTALAALIYFALIPRIGAGRLQQVNYVVPVIGMLLGVAVLGERPGWNGWAAMPLIALGVMLVTTAPNRAMRS